MFASDMIKELHNRIFLYGDSEVIFRDNDGDDDIDILSIYHDEDAGRIVLSNHFSCFTDNR